MDTMMQDQVLWMVVGVLLLLTVILFIMILVQASRLKKLRCKYNDMMDGTGVKDLEELIIEMKEHIYALQEGQSEHTQAIQGLNVKMKKSKSNVGFLRYNPFRDNGSDLSFSLAIVNEEQDGIILSGLHSRDSTYVYAKPIEEGKSKYALSPEEEEALSLAERKA